MIKSIDGVLMNILDVRQLNPSTGIDKERLVRSMSQFVGGARVEPILFKAVPQGQPAPWPFGRYLRDAGITPVWIQGETREEEDDQAILRTLRELRGWAADVWLLSHDGGFAKELQRLAEDPKRRVGVAGFQERLSKKFRKPMIDGEIEFLDLEDDLAIFDAPLPRMREIVVSPDDFDPAALLSALLDGVPKKLRGEIESEVDWATFAPALSEYEGHPNPPPHVGFMFSPEGRSIRGLAHVLSSEGEDAALLGRAISYAERLDWTPPDLSQTDIGRMLAERGIDTSSVDSENASRMSQWIQHEIHDRLPNATAKLRSITAASLN